MDLEAFVDVLGDFRWEEPMGSSTVVREAIGVVGAITPWNFPLHQITAKTAAALAAGCTIVVKPSEVAPLTAYLFADVLDDAGLPPGVFNMVTGDGGVGEALVRHPEVDMVSFTGSNRVGKRVAAVAAEHVKKVALELGGKSANVILDDADLNVVVKDGVRNCYQNAGQTCAALTRMLVPRSRLAEAETIAVAAAEAHTMGDPFERGTYLGPLVSAAQRDRVRVYLEHGRREGARLLTGGADAAVPERGYFVAPTVFSSVRPEMIIAQEEIFGPVLAIIPYDTEEEAVSIANGTIYGLAAAVWSGDQARAERVGRRLRAAQVTINGGAFNPMAPFGGYKQSGLGREGGRYGLEEYLEVKSLQIGAPSGRGGRHD